MKGFGPDGGWRIHAYYTLCPEAPDGSGRVLYASADLETGLASVHIADADGRPLESFGAAPTGGAFWHTGLWQSWSPDARYVYYQTGSGMRPKVTRRELATGIEATIDDADLEGAPTGHAPPISGMLGMLYAAGYGDGHYHPEQSPIPFAARDAHGLFAYDFDAGGRRLALSVQDVLDAAPDAQLARWDAAQRARTGDGLTLMLYCLRWSADGRRLLFHMGNHCVDKRRGEPRVLKIYTADASLGDIREALDLCGRPGVHWSWQPDGVSLIGYGPDPDAPDALALCAVSLDGTGFLRLSRHASGGHPSLHPFLSHLALTDTGGQPGEVLVLDLRDDRVVWSTRQDREHGPQSIGRNPNRVCHHPVFSRDGKSIYFNRMQGPLAQLVRVRLPEEVLAP